MSAAFVVMLAALIGLGIGCGAALIVAGLAWRDRLAARRAAHEALTRAALAESALHDIKQRRSAATAKGNRTRGAAQAEKHRAKTEEIRLAVAAKRDPEPGFPFSTSQTGGTHG